MDCAALAVLRACAKARSDRLPATPTCFAAPLWQVGEANPLRDKACGSEKAQRHRCVRQRCARCGRPSDFRRRSEQSEAGAPRVPLDSRLPGSPFLGAVAWGEAKPRRRARRAQCRPWPCKALRPPAANRCRAVGAASHAWRCIHPTSTPPSGRCPAAAACQLLSAPRCRRAQGMAVAQGEPSAADTAPFAPTLQGGWTCQAFTPQC